MTWFTEFLDESAREWFAEADQFDFEADQAMRRGDVFTWAQSQGQAMAFRRMGRKFRRCNETLTEATA